MQWFAVGRPAGSFGLVVLGALMYVFSRAAKFGFFKPAEEMVYLRLFVSTPKVTKSRGGARTRPPPVGGGGPRQAVRAQIFHPPGQVLPSTESPLPLSTGQQRQQIFVVRKSFGLRAQTLGGLGRAAAGASRPGTSYPAPPRRGPPASSRPPANPVSASARPAGAAATRRAAWNLGTMEAEKDVAEAASASSSAAGAAAPGATAAVARKSSSPLRDGWARFEERRGRRTPPTSPDKKKKAAVVPPPPPAATPPPAAAPLPPPPKESTPLNSPAVPDAAGGESGSPRRKLKKRRRSAGRRCLDGIDALGFFYALYLFCGMFALVFALLAFFVWRQLDDLIYEIGGAHPDLRILFRGGVISGGVVVVFTVLYFLTSSGLLLCSKTPLSSPERKFGRGWSCAGAMFLGALIFDVATQFMSYKDIVHRLAADSAVAFSETLLLACMATGYLAGVLAWVLAITFWFWRAPRRPAPGGPLTAY